ncbi:hypothetical protein PV416_02075 [Streptomyces ipomoeae]|uniref:hypothetical protein n=1 Tax=Streptomyces ipomoeae TaxID=103232 RepID=UPI0029BDFAA7|nr:hypothetical protein [Streptomyces ipomoeae]MDX2819889.1 hypothetical protein [Streptomyces ipomoeae]MDX2872293.1 hypothetical protein [Streptomyces ipomoeae]
MTAPHPRRPRALRPPRAGGDRTGGDHDLRVLRAAVFAAACVVLAGAGHALASCATIPLWSLGAGFAGVFAVAAVLAGRERSLPGISALLAVGQTVLHALFGLSQHGMASAASSRAAETMDAALVERAAQFVCGTTAAALSPAQARRILVDAGLGTHITHPADAMTTAVDSSGSVLPSLPMLLGHVLAAVATGWVLRHGDLALLRLVRLSGQEAHEPLVRSLRAALALARTLRWGLPDAPDAVSRAPRTPYAASPALCTTALQHTVIRRGPPTAELALAA